MAIGHEFTSSQTQLHFLLQQFLVESIYRVIISKNLTPESSINSISPLHACNAFSPLIVKFSRHIIPFLKIIYKRCKSKENNLCTHERKKATSIQ